MFHPDHALHGVERFDFQTLPFVQFTLEDEGFVPDAVVELDCTYAQAFVLQIGIFEPFDERASVPSMFATLAEICARTVTGDHCRVTFFLRHLDRWIVVHLVVLEQ